METVLITGASSGIGYEFSKLFAEKGYNLVLTARRENKLYELKNMFPNIKIEVIPCDLSIDTSIKYLYEEIKKREIHIDILINNAGFGLFGEFLDTDINKEINMIDLNIKALVRLTKLFSKDMIKQNSGKILNVASIAAFQPGPYMSVYYASKSFVLSFSEAFRNELKDTNIKISTLCPGPVKTEFEKSAQLYDSKLFSIIKPIDAGDVARIGYIGLMKGKSIIIPGFFNKTAVFMNRLLPRNIIVNITRKIQEKKK